MVVGVRIILGFGSMLELVVEIDGIYVGKMAVQYPLRGF